MPSNLLHLNDNVLCAISLKTSGPRPWYHDMYEICIYPLDAELKPARILPFNLSMQLKREENLDAETERKLVKQRLAIDPWDAAEIFERWITKLNLKFRKRIVPLSKHWAYDRGFIIDWLNEKAFEDFIDENLARDIFSTVMYVNDKADFMNDRVPFSKTNFQYLCSTLKLEIPVKKDLMWEAINISKIYRHLCKEQNLIGG